MKIRWLPIVVLVCVAINFAVPASIKQVAMKVIKARGVGLERANFAQEFSLKVVAPNPRSKLMKAGVRIYVGTQI